MKLVSLLTLFLTWSLAAFAQQPKGADNCAPPPSSLAPTLPARILPGMGTVHLAITRSAAVLRPGSGADAFLLGA